jgi:hypothetical protein
MENNIIVSTPDGFPNPLADKKTKESEAYTLAYAKAMYAQFGKFGLRAFWNDRDQYSILENYALGMQPIDKYKKLMDSWEDEPGKNSFLNINWSVLNLASKFVNIMVDKIVATGYDVQCSAIDPLALDAKRERAAKIRAVMEHKAWLTEMQIPLDPQELGFSPDMLPDHVDELEMFMAMNDKDKFAMNAEMAIDLHFTNNEFEQVRREYIRDSIIYGPMGVEARNDVNGNTRIKRINPKNTVVGNSKSEDFKNVAHGGYIEQMSFAELQAEAGSKFTQEQYEDIYKNYSALLGPTQSESTTSFYSGPYERSNERTVSVLKFYYKTGIKDTYVKKKDSRGNSRLYEQGPNTKEKEGQTIIRDVYEVVFEGHWIVNSNYLYNSGKMKDMEVDESAPCNTTIPLHIIWPNMLDGKGASILSYCIPVFDLIQNNWNNFQHMLAQIRPDGEAINVDALADIAFGAGGKKLTPKEILDLYYKRGTILFSGKGLDGTQNGNALPIIPLNNNNYGKAEGYLNNVFALINILRQITGMNEGVDASTPSPDALVGTMQMAAIGANSALSYIQTADRLMVKHIAESCIKLTQNAIRRGEVSGYIDSVGIGAVNYWSVNKDITQRQLGIKVIARPSEAEWREFYGRITMMADTGAISVSDLIVMQEMTNLKQARQYMAMVEKRRKREAMQMQQAQMEQQGELNKQSAMMTAQASQEALQMEMQLKASLIKMEMERELAVLDRKYGYDIQLKQMEMNQKADAATIQAKTKVVDTTLKNETSKSIADAKNLVNHAIAQSKNSTKEKASA